MFKIIMVLFVLSAVGCGAFTEVAAVAEEQRQNAFEDCCTCLDEHMVSVEGEKDQQKCLVSGESGGDAKSDDAIAWCVVRMDKDENVLAHPGCFRDVCGDRCWFIPEVKEIP